MDNAELRVRLLRGDAERQANMLLAVTPDSFIPEEHPIRRIKPIVESAAADRARLGGARLQVCSAHPEPPRVPRRVRMEVRRVGRQGE